MSINVDDHAARTAARNAQTVWISKIDPETATLGQCEAALSYMFQQHEHCSALGFRTPKLIRKADGMFIVMIAGKGSAMPQELSTPGSAFYVGKGEGSFLGELLAHIPKAERPLYGHEQCVTSLKPLAAAIVTMATNNKWDYPLPTLTREISA